VSLVALRHRLILAITGTLAATDIPAQQALQANVGILSIGTDPAAQENWEPFINELERRGYVEGRNLRLQRAFAAGDVGRLPKLIADLVSAKVDVIVATGSREIRAAMQATSEIPIVMTLAADPVKEGFIASLRRPGGNVTGLTSLVPGLSQKQLELVHETFPLARRFAILGIPPNPIAEIRGEFESAAKVLGLEVFFVQPASADEFDSAMALARRGGAEAIIHPQDGATFTRRQDFVRAALNHRLPGLYWGLAYVEAGGLMTYSVNPAEQYRRGAVFVDRILHGAKPSELPVELPVHVELVINLKTAKVLGVKVPQSILLRADRLIE
jgi:putative ABC transport system substrate-binding protein